MQDDEPSSFQTVAGARILIDATAYKADAASLDALAQAAQRLEAAGAVAVRRDLAEIFTPLDGIWEIVSRSEGRTANPVGFECRVETTHKSISRNREIIALAAARQNVRSEHRLP